MRMELPDGVSIKDVRECRNSKCKRNGYPQWAPGRRTCAECEVKLKGMSWRSRDNLDRIIIDPAEAALTLVTGKGDSKTMFHQNQASPLQDYKALTYSNFKGDMAGYREYLAQLGIHNFMEFAEWKETPEGKKMEPRDQWDEYEKWRMSIGIEPFVTTKNVHKGGGNVIHYAPAASRDTFTVIEPPPITACSLALVEKIELPNVMWHRWLYLAKAFETEWIAYLKGHKREADGVWEITEMYFPKQKVTPSHVDAEDGEIQDGTIGAVHSHVAMSAFFSQEDVKHANHTIELVVNRKGEFDSAVRIQLPCGNFMRVKATLTVTGMEEDVAAVEQLEGKIISTTRSTGFHTKNSRGSGRHGRYHNDHFDDDGGNPNINLLS